MNTFKSKLTLPKPKGEIIACVNKANGEVVDYRETNTITSRSFDMMFNANIAPGGLFKTVYEFLAIGSGTNIITEASVSLQTQTGARVTGTDAVTQADIAGTIHDVFTVTHQYQIGDVSGTITEIGLYSSSTGDTLTAGKLLDTPIAVDIDDQLTIQYSIMVPKLIFPIALGAGQVNIAGQGLIDYTMTLRSEHFYNASNNMGYLIPNAAATGSVYSNDVIIGSGSYTYSCSRTFDGVSKIATWTMNLLIRPSAGVMSIGKLGIGASSRTGPNQTGNNRTIDVTFSTPIAKGADKKIVAEFEFELQWV